MISTERAILEIEAMGFHPFHHDGESDVVHVSAEYGDGAADYWDSRLPGLGDFGINTRLHDWADKNGLFWEWVNPGCIAAYPV